MKQSATKILYSYWNELRGERLAPDRREIDPAAIRTVLSDTFMLDVDVARQFPIRLAGARMCSLYTSQLKGTCFRSLWDPADRNDIGSVIESVIGDPAPAVLGVSCAPPGRTPVELEILLLPLRHQGRTHSRILGLMSHVCLPTWLGLIPVGPLRLNTLRHVANDEVPAIAPVIRGHLGALRSLRASHLHVYAGGKSVTCPRSE